MFAYKIYDLNVVSEFRISSLTEINKEQVVADVEVRYGRVPKRFDKVDYHEEGVQISNGRFLLHVLEVARYLVTDGKYITIDKFDNANEQFLLTYLLGSAFGALLHQREMLPIHGSCVAFGKTGSIIFCGDSGAGKSTIAAALNQNGAQILADDVSVISDIHNSNPKVLPAIPRLKLWENSISALDMSLEGSVEVCEGKFQLNTHNKYAGNRADLTAIVHLEASSLERRFTWNEINHDQALNILITHTYRNSFLHGLGSKSKHFLNCVALVNKISVYHLKRPSNDSINLNEWVNFVQEHLNQLQ